MCIEAGFFLDTSINFKNHKFIYEVNGLNIFLNNKYNSLTLTFSETAEK